MQGHEHNMIDLDSRSILWLFFLIIIGIVIFWVRDRNRSKNDDVSITETPLELLKKCYAKGEINKEEFEEKKKDLREE